MFSRGIETLVLQTFSFNMKSAILLLLAVWCSAAHCKSLNGRKVVDVLPPPDGNLNVYSLPVGQGDSHVIQCPSGQLTVYDMGSSDYDVGQPNTGSRFWLPSNIRSFFGSQDSLIENVFFTHNHYDHYILMTDTFTNATDLPGLKNIYMSCTQNDMASYVLTWITTRGYEGLIRIFNNGAPCGPYDNAPCDPVALCPDDPQVVSWVMGANLGAHCSDGGNKNMDSLVLKVEVAGTSITMPGDFEDETTSWTENGLQKLMADYYGARMATTVYVISHHGASSLANKPVFQDALVPKALMGSANSEYSYHHPRCSVIDGFINYTQSVCKPMSTSADPGFCGTSYNQGVPDNNRVQTTYTCGVNDNSCPNNICLRTNNEFALYTTVPTNTTLQVVHLAIDASGSWGIFSEVQ